MNEPVRSLIFRIALLAAMMGMFVFAAVNARADNTISTQAAAGGRTVESADVREGASLRQAVISSADLRAILRDAGLLMYAILLCSFLLVAFFLERTIFLRRRRVIPKPFIKRFLQQLNEGRLHRDEALELCRENGSPIAQVFAGAVRKWGRPEVEVEQGAIDAGERVAFGLRKHLRVFYGIATVGPLLGLMGTVLGMIQTFNAIADPAAEAIGRTAPLAGGIAKALLNTAGGLAVAIPASILYTYFIARVDRLIVEIDQHAQEVVNVISAEEAVERKTRRAA